MEKKRTELVEKVAEFDEQLGEMFLMEEPIDAATLKAAIRRQVGIRCVHLPGQCCGIHGR